MLPFESIPSPSESEAATVSPLSFVSYSIAQSQTRLLTEIEIREPLVEAFIQSS